MSDDGDSDVDVQDLFNDSDDVDSDVDVQGLFNDSDDGEEFMGFEDPASEGDESYEDVDFESELVVKKTKKQVLMKKSSLRDGMINIGKMEMAQWA